MFRIVSNGYIVMAPWVILSNPEDNFAAEWLVGVQDWVEENLEAKLHHDGAKKQQLSPSQNVVLIDFFFDLLFQVSIPACIWTTRMLS